MREIKFRLRSTKTRKVIDDSIPAWVVSDGRVLMESNEPVFYGNDHVDDIAVKDITDLVTVELYTGLKDMKGKEIYDADLVLIDGDRCVVGYDQETASYIAKSVNQDRCWALDKYTRRVGVKVIGDIYEGESHATGA